MSRTVTAPVPVREPGPGSRRAARAAEAAARPSRRWLLGPLVVLVVAAVARLWAIGVPHVLVFDETFYVKDAWTILHLGYEGSWPKNADAAFQAGQVDVFTKAAEYVAHPPLGKWIIGLGELVTGAANPVGWRLSVAIVGVLAVALVMLVAHRMFATPLVTTVAGGLFAIDNQAILMSRVGLLDNMVMFFALAGFACLLEDRFWTERRLGGWLMGHSEGGGWGPLLLWRPWLLGAGVLLGLCTAVKWSGLYFLAVFAVYTVAVDMMLRRRAGVRFWYSASLLKQAPAVFVNLVPPALVAYLASWTGWFVTSGGWDRAYIQDGGQRFTGLLAWVPVPLQNLWAWHAEIYAFHIGLETPHPYSTPAILWPLIARPTSMYWDPSSPGGGSGCQWGSCASAITDLPNPLIWYASVAAALYLVVRFARRREWQAGLLLVGIVAGWAPWLLYPQRTMFFFYSIAFEPYLVLCLAAVIGLMVVRPAAASSPDAILAAEARYGMRVRRGIVIGFLAVAVLLSVFFYPLDTAMQTPWWFWHIHMWSPTWI